MSTKYSITNGDNYHLYREVGIPDPVYLQINKTHFEATPEHITVAIPLYIWESIRQFQVADFEWVDKSDADIEQHAQQVIKQRLHDHQHAESRTRIVAACTGLMIYGDIEKPEEVQVATTIAYYKGLREQQQKVRLMMKD